MLAAFDLTPTCQGSETPRKQSALTQFLRFCGMSRGLPRRSPKNHLATCSFRVVVDHLHFIQPLLFFGISPFMWGFSLWETLFVVSQKWIPFLTALLFLFGPPVVRISHKRRPGSSGAKKPWRSLSVSFLWHAQVPLANLYRESAQAGKFFFGAFCKWLLLLFCATNIRHKNTVGFCEGLFSYGRVARARLRKRRCVS